MTDWLAAAVTASAALLAVECAVFAVVGWRGVPRGLFLGAGLYSGALAVGASAFVRGGVR